MFPKCLIELYPGNRMTFRLNSYEVCPLGTGGTSQLLSSKQGLLSFRASDQFELLFHHVDPLVHL
jgi:hypothetical protein